MVNEQRREEYRLDLVRIFRTYARFYDLIEWVIPFVKVNPRRVVAAAVPADANTVLDACTGNAAVLATVAQTHTKTAVFGLDLSPDMLSLAKRRISRLGLANVQLFPGDCTRMPFPDDTFDAVTLSYGLHEMPRDVRQASLHEALRVLKPGGVFAAIDWDEPHRLRERVVARLRDMIEPDYINELFGEGLPREIAEAGFKEITSRRDIIASQLVVAEKPCD